MAQSQFKKGANYQLDEIAESYVLTSIGTIVKLIINSMNNMLPFNKSSFPWVPVLFPLLINVIMLAGLFDSIEKFRKKQKYGFLIGYFVLGLIGVYCNLVEFTTYVLMLAVTFLAFLRPIKNKKNNLAQDISNLIDTVW